MTISRICYVSSIAVMSESKHITHIQTFLYETRHNLSCVDVCDDTAR